MPRHLARQRFGAFARGVLDMLLPAACPGCRSPLDTPGALCPQCWSKLVFLGAPRCQHCGLPFPDEEDGPVCGGCLAHPPIWDVARAAVAYDDASRGLIIAFKHRDRLDLAPLLARWVAADGADLLRVADLVVPVPLHWTRLLSRRFNQSAVLARKAAVPVGATILPDLLIRRRRTPTQGRFTRKGRQRNVAHAFALSPRHRARVAGSRIVLVDDVMTTGATVEACARVLRRAGAAHIAVLTVARVLRPL